MNEPSYTVEQVVRSRCGRFIMKVENGSVSLVHIPHESTVCELRFEVDEIEHIKSAIEAAEEGMSQDK